MRKLCSIFLIGILSLSLLSCSSKKEEIPEHLKGDVLDFSEDKESKSCIHEEDYSKLLVQVDSVINFFKIKILF